MLIIVIIEDSR